MLTRSDPEPPPVSAEAERVYDAIGAYAFGEAVAWPSQDRIAADLDRTREHVNRKVRELREAGWLTVTKRPGRKGWWHNVYELLEAWTPPTKAFVERVVARAKRRRERPITLTQGSRADEGPRPRLSEAVRVLAATYGLPMLA